MRNLIKGVLLSGLMIVGSFSYDDWSGRGTLQKILTLMPK